MEYIDVINDLNQEIYDNFGDVEEQFYYTTNGYIDIIGFGDIMLWNSEDDDREFIEEVNDYEPVAPFIKRKFNEYIDNLIKLKFKDSEK